MKTRTKPFTFFRRHALVLSIVALGVVGAGVASFAFMAAQAGVTNDMEITEVKSGSESPRLTEIADNGPRGKALYNDGRLADEERPAAISSQPIAVWLGEWNGNPAEATRRHTNAAARQGKLPTFVLYNIPLRDCGMYSAGGSANFAEYQNWVNGVAEGIGQREAIVILEPDALAGIECLDARQKADRLNGLRAAITTLTGKTKAYVYIDAGNATWISAKEMADRLRSVGVNKARGFALNVSNFLTVSESVEYGAAISKLINDKPFVIDTSRSGQGAYTNTDDPEAWCNPPGRGLGPRPTTATEQPLVDAYLWVKAPGESDGTCRGGPTAGDWYEAYTQELIRNANYEIR